VVGSRLEPQTFETHSEQETIDAGARVGRLLRGGEVVRLFGDLGVGKTAFVRGLAAGLGLDPDQVTSPTFTLVQEYRGPVTLQHIDLYRLEPAEVADLGLDDLADAATVLAVEWAERLPRPPQPPVVDVRFETIPEGRRIRVIGVWGGPARD
jgi:tRNA threonylcarbamoyladenosine biosynthesis protein TsaE